MNSCQLVCTIGFSINILFKSSIVIDQSIRDCHMYYSRHIIYKKIRKFEWDTVVFGSRSNRDYNGV